MPNTSAKICMNSGLVEPPPEITTSRSVVPSSAVIASTLSFMVSAMASRIER